MAIATPQFYNPLPIFGRRLDRQWHLFRDDFNSLAPIVRGSYIDVNDNNDAEHDLSGLAIGELDFRNRYRTFYDKSLDSYLIQYNTGTEDAPVWTTRVTIRDSDGRLTVNSPGGFLSVGGFYNFGGVDVKESEAGGASFVSAGTIIFDSSSGFYINPDSTGKPVVSISVEAAAGTVTDGTNVGSQAGVFKDKSGTTLRFKSLAGSGLITATENTNTIDFATSAENNTGSNLGSGTGVFESKVASDLRFKSLVGTGGVAISASASEITIDSSANKFYGITFKESQSGGRVEVDDTLVVDSAYFYLDKAGDDQKPLLSLGAASVGANLGNGEGPYASTQGLQLRFKSLTGSGGARVSSTDTEINVDTSANKFYGIIFKESEAGGFVEQDDTLVFNSEHFYVTQDADGKPLVSLGAASVGTNLGNGQGVYASQQGLQLRFKSLTSTGKIKLTADSEEINIAGEFYLDDLLDVDAGSPKNGQLLTWNSSTGVWEPTDTPHNQVNAFINGNFDIWQRGTSFDKIDNFRYGPDRFAFFYAGGTGVDGIDIDRDSTLIPDGLSEYSMKLTVDTADTSIGASETYAFFQGIEGYNIQHFGFGSSDAKVATLSFWVRSSVAGTYCIFLKNALQGAAARTQIREYQVNAANTWEFKEITFTADTTGTWSFVETLGLVVGWTLACGSSLQTTPNAWGANGAYGTEHQVNWLATAGNTFNIARAQLEIGSFATNIRSLIVDEMQRCQRYYAKTFRTDTTPADGLGTTGALIGKGANGSVDIEPLVNWFLPVTMRVVPTVTLFNTRAGGAIGQWQIGSFNDGANARVISTSETLVVIDNTGIPLAAGSQAFIHVTVDAEF